MRYIILLLMIFLAGCTAKEPENRDFVMVMGISKSDNYNLSASIAKLDDENKSTILYSSEADTLPSAIDDLNMLTSGELFLGAAQAILTDSDIQAELAELINTNMEIGRDIPVIKCSNIDTVLSFENDKISLQDYISQYFDNYTDKKINIETYLNDSEYNNTLPELKLINDNYIID